MKIRRAAVVGAGNMGSGIAQKTATEGVEVWLADVDKGRAEAGRARIEKTVAEGVKRRVFSPRQAEAALSRVNVANKIADLGDMDLVIEAVFEDLAVKRDVLGKVADVCRDDAIIATNTSSFKVAQVADGMPAPERFVGLHYFYHPAKNRLVEVIPHATTTPDVVYAAWRFQERIGKTPISSLDAPGFVVNRFFVPWLNEAARLHQEGLGIDLIERAARRAFGVGMGPFGLMNVTGVPIAMHAARSLGDSLGEFYDCCDAIARQVELGTPWEIGEFATPSEDAPQTADEQAVADRLWGVVFGVAGDLVSEGVASREDVDIGARVGLRWPRGPFAEMLRRGSGEVAEIVNAFARRYRLPQATWLDDWSDSGIDFSLELVRSSICRGILTITINRPDQLNALDPDTVTALGEAFDQGVTRDDVDAVIIKGAGKAFVAGADIKYFVDRMRAGTVDEIVGFATTGQQLFSRIEKSPKPVICQLDGLALGGGAELAMACHARIATTKASMGFPETGIGIYPGLGGTQRLTRALGLGLGRFYLATGNQMSAGILKELGIVSDVVEHDDLDEALGELATRLTAAAARPDRVNAEIVANTGETRQTDGALAKFLAELNIDEMLRLAAGDKLMIDRQPAEAVNAKLQKRLSQKAEAGLRAVWMLSAIAAKEAVPGGNPERGLLAETDGLFDIFSNADALEGMSAVLDGRRPKFSGFTVLDK